MSYVNLQEATSKIYQEFSELLIAHLGIFFLVKKKVLCFT